MLFGNTLKGALGKLAVVTAAVCVFTFATGEQAQAQRCGTFYGNAYRPAQYGGYRYSNNFGRYYGNGVRVNVGRVSFSVGNGGFYHGNYYGPRYGTYYSNRRVYNRNHFHTIPSHYRNNRGYWHYHHR